MTRHYTWDARQHVQVAHADLFVAPELPDRRLVRMAPDIGAHARFEPALVWPKRHAAQIRQAQLPELILEVGVHHPAPNARQRVNQSAQPTFNERTARSVQRAIKSQSVMSTASNPRPARRSNDGQTILRETGKRRPDLVVGWLTPRVHRASGVTVREAVKPLSPDQRDELLAAYRANKSRAGQPRAGQPRADQSPLAGQSRKTG